MNRAVVSIDDSVSPPKYKLFVEGDDFDKVLSTYGVNPTRTKSNNTFEVRVEEDSNLPMQNPHYQDSPILKFPCFKTIHIVV